MKSMRWMIVGACLAIGGVAIADKSNCDEAVTDDLETRGDKEFAAGKFKAALDLYSEAVPCRPTVKTKAYLAACRAREFVIAKKLFRELKDDRFAPICLKEGFDPRK